MHSQDSASTRPYLLRALHEWCSDNGLTPYIVVRVDASVQAPREYVNDGEIVLNVSLDATSALQLENDYISFKARFGGKPHEIIVPVGRVVAIYARENGQGMAFALEGDEVIDGVALPVPDAGAPAAPVLSSVPDVNADHEDPPVPPAPAGSKRPALRRVK